MPLIKNGQSASLIKGAAVLDLGDLDRQAKQIIENARAKAKQVLDEAQREVQHLINHGEEVGRAQGFEQGLKEGREQGLREGREQAITEFKPHLEKVIQSWTAAMERWEQQRAEMLLSAREDVLAFAVAMGEKVIFRTIEADGTIIEDQLAEALSLLSKPSAATIRINPADRPLVDEVLPELMRIVRDCKHVDIRDDEAITRGGCIVSTAGGAIDATIETQLDRIVDSILPWAKEASDERQTEHGNE